MLLLYLTEQVNEEIFLISPGISSKVYICTTFYSLVNMRTLTGLIQGQPIECMTSRVNCFVWESSNFFMLQARLCKVLISYRIEEGGRELFVAFDSYGEQSM